MEKVSFPYKYTISLGMLIFGVIESLPRGQQHTTAKSELDLPVHMFMSKSLIVITFYVSSFSSDELTEDINL